MEALLDSLPIAAAAATTGTVVVKQALPYLRCAEDWPLTLERGRFEYMGLVEMSEHCHGLVPEPYHFDEVLGALVMEYIPPTHTVLRYSLIEGRRYSTFARHLGTFLARSLFFTSGIHLTGPQLRAKVAFWSTNAEMNDVLLQCIFVEPWVETPTNRWTLPQLDDVAASIRGDVPLRIAVAELREKWTSPQLDDVAASIRGDVPLRIAVAELREKFMCETQALIHSDFHTGAAMVCEGSTFVIDPEFAVYGPMGFEVGAILAGLIISYCSQRGHRSAAELDAYGDWLLAQVVTLHETFERAFLALWSDPALAAGCTWPQRQFAGEGELRAAQAHFMRRLWRDTVGFAGVKVMRRIIGRIHFDDFETIVDADVRAACERRALTIGRTLVKEPDSVANALADKQCHELDNVMAHTAIAILAFVAMPGWTWDLLEPRNGSAAHSEN
ncbi:kinase-like domain-containing protein [Tribonema minus]|uniref:Kinase-like domain-containing protein n=1 Tax=Tribonema minus TaxID=303371 RepID=A0A836C8J9_9STRA|nr:kinase-like domain-containing protein [Tribonema minus]